MFSKHAAIKFLHQPTRSDQMRLKLDNTVLVSQRFGVSNRATSAFASSVIQDLGLISEQDISLVIDKNKIWREKSRIYKNLVSKSNESRSTLSGLYFDGRRDKTLTSEIHDGKLLRKTIVEEHYSIGSEPGSTYMEHVTPESGSSLDISNIIYEYGTSVLLDDFSNLVVLGCDGTAVNTGVFNGVIRRLELKLQRPIQWIICLLHFNELPLRHLFESIDGKSSGPNSYAGDIGRNLKGCEKLPVVSFNIIACELPDIDPTTLSSDQKYLFEICTAISSGFCSSDLAYREPGLLNLARWLTTANRILRFYISSLDSSKELLTLVEFILKVYAPSWFQIKIHRSIKDGARHLWHFIVSSRYLSKKYRAIIDAVISRNAYFAAPENMLLAMLTDDRSHIRTLAARRIIKAREISPDRNNVRRFVIPAVNFDAVDYVDLIDWHACNVTSPPALREISSQKLRKMMQYGMPMDCWDFIKFPSHTQAVERIVKLVTEASTKSVGQQNRDKFI